MANQKVDRNEAVTLRKFGFTYKQIAEKLGCSQQWCATHLSNIKVNDFYMETAYELFKKQIGATCEMCGTNFVTDEDSEFYYDREDDYATGKKFCSGRCRGHYLLDDNCLEGIYGKDYKKM